MSSGRAHNQTDSHFGRLSEHVSAGEHTSKNNHDDDDEKKQSWQLHENVSFWPGFWGKNSKSYVIEIVMSLGDGEWVSEITDSGAIWKWKLWYAEMWNANIMFRNSRMNNIYCWNFLSYWNRISASLYNIFLLARSTEESYGPFVDLWSVRKRLW